MKLIDDTFSVADSNFYCLCHSPDTEPGSEGHDTMMENMEGREVLPFLSQHKEKGVDGVNQL